MEALHEASQGQRPAFWSLFDVRVSPRFDSLASSATAKPLCCSVSHILTVNINRMDGTALPFG